MGQCQSQGPISVKDEGPDETPSVKHEGRMDNTSVQYGVLGISFCCRLADESQNADQSDPWRLPRVDPTREFPFR